jgi:hypothetical protein
MLTAIDLHLGSQVHRVTVTRSVEEGALLE